MRHIDLRDGQTIREKAHQKLHEVDVVIIGAGPAGSSAAALLHAQGLDVAVVEKQVFPRFAIGESLLPHCMDLLEEAALLDVIASRGFTPKHGAMFLEATGGVTSISPTIHLGLGLHLPSSSRRVRPDAGRHRCRAWSRVLLRS